MKNHLTDSETNLDALLKETLNQETPPEAEAAGREQLASFQRRLTNRDRNADSASGIASSARPTNLLFQPRAIAAMALAASIVMAGVLFWNPAQNRVYAQAVERVEASRTFTCKITMKETMNGQSGKSVVSIAFKEPGFVRSVLANGTSTNTSVLDLSNGRGITFSSTQRTYTQLGPNLTPTMAGIDLITFWKSLPERADSPIGEQSLNGKTARGFRVKHTDRTYTVWIYPDTREIVRIEDGSTVMTDLKFGGSLDDSLFELTPPAGYRKAPNALERVQDKVNAALQDKSDAHSQLLYVNEIISLWHSGRKDDAMKLALETPQAKPKSVTVLECLRVKESDIPTLDPDQRARIQRQFNEAATAAKQLCREIRVRIAKADKAGDSDTSEIYKQRHQAFGRKLMKSNYAALLNLVGTAIYKFKFD